MTNQSKINEQITLEKVYMQSNYEISINYANKWEIKS